MGEKLTPAEHPIANLIAKMAAALSAQYIANQQTAKGRADTDKILFRPNRPVSQPPTGAKMRQPSM